MSYQGPEVNPQQQYPQPESQYSNYQPGSQPTDPYNPPPYGQPPVYGQQQGYQQPTGYGQQPGYQQYGAPGVQQQYQQPTAFPGTGTTNLSSNVVAALSYVFVWIGAIVCLVTRKRDHFVSFHAMQSLLFFSSVTLLSIVLQVCYYSINGAITDTLLPILWNLVSLAGVVGWIVLSIMAYQSKYFKLPVIGAYAQRYADKNAGPQGRI
ncbi:MAG: hypothetical protein PVS3B3_37910 [Ktedonobacteraceae bacterium]